MQHEIFLALAGCPGSTFTVSRESGLFEVITDLPFIHPSEVAILNRLSGLGTYYKQLNDFTKQQTTFCTALDLIKDEGNLYHKAMAYGFDKVLDSYRKKLVDVEQKCMMQPDLPISHIQHEFEDFQLLLPALDLCLKYVHNHKLQGCQILSFLHQQCSSGISAVETAFTRILYTCHHVFYKQLSAWMLHGLLLDQKGEFFIEKIELSQSSEVEQREVDEEAPTAGPFSGTEKATSEFRINGQLAPSYLPQTVLEKILFIGEAVQIFQTLHASGAHPPLASFSVSSGGAW
jgi:gamma-tubulin complex component 4